MNLHSTIPRDLGDTPEARAKLAALAKVRATIFERVDAAPRSEYRFRDGLTAAIAIIDTEAARIRKEG